MKRIILLLTIIAIVFLSGCKAKKQAAQTVQTPIAEESVKPILISGAVTRFYIDATIGKNHLNTPATLEWQAGVGAIVSIRPFMGIEMFRLEAYPDHAVAISTMDKQYTSMTYEQLEQEGLKINYTKIEKILKERIFETTDDPITIRHSAMGSTVIVTIERKYITTNNTLIVPTDLKLYQGVRADQLIK